MISRRDILVSVVIRIRDAEPFLENALARLTETMERDFKYYEIVIVDDASQDGGPELVERAQRRSRNIQYYRLARRRGDDIALIAGLDHAIGDMVVLLDPWLDPPETIPKMVDLAIGGASIVYALPRERVASRTIYNRLLNRFLAFLARLNGVEVPTAISSCRLLSRAVVNFILEATNRHRILMIAPALSGHPFATLQYERLAREHVGDTSPGRFGTVVKALDLTLSSSVRPLRIVTIMSLGICALTMLYSVYVIVVSISMEHVANGWASLSLQVSGLFFLICLILAVLAEYLLQVFEMSSRRPLYNISRQGHSSLIDYAQRRNVVSVGKVPDPAAGRDRRAATGSAGPTA